MHFDVRASVANGFLGVILLGPSPVAAADGAEAIAQVLNVAVPRRFVDPKSRAMTPGALVGRLQKQLAKVVCPGPLCPEGRSLQVQLAVGSDYEVLDWLGKGLIDAGVIPTLSLYLLNGDQIDLLEVGPSSSQPSESTPRSLHLASGAWLGPAESRQDFEAARDWIWCRAVKARVEVGRAPPGDREQQRCRERLASGDPSYELVMPSHLSTSGFLMPVAETAKWLSERTSLARGTGPPTAQQQALTERFWQEFFAHTRFTLGGPDLGRGARATPTKAIFFREGMTSPRATELKNSPGAPSDLPDLSPDHLVIRRTAKVFSPRALNRRPEAGQGAPTTTVPDPLHSILLADPPGPKAFRSLRFSEPSFGVRTFAFTVDESIELLRHHHDDIEDTRLALVLPGGGVKAAYQSRLLDYLYSKGHLRNYQTPRDPERRALPVNYVIGTSGGALFGFFVARLDERGPWQLSDVLWKKCSEDEPDRCRPLRSTDIFGFVDMPRYLSLLVIFVVFWFFLSTSNLIWTSAPPQDPAARARRKMWRLRLLFVMGPILVLTPILIRYVNGTVAREHIPAIEGIFYAVFALIVMFVDQCVIRDDSQVETVGHGWRRLGIGLTVVGGSTMALCLLAKWKGSPRWLSEVDVSQSIQNNSFLVCVGALLLLVGATLWTYTSMPHYLLADVRGFLTGVGLALTFMVFVYLVLLAIVMFLPGWLSFLELTGQFWGWLLATSIVLSLAILGLEAATRRIKPQWLSPINDGVRYLSDNHPNGDLVTRRSFRLILTASVAVAWWNFVVAPGLYGNVPAQRFMTSVIRQFDRAYESANHRSSTRLTSSLIVPTNDLDKNQTAYFLFAPGIGECPSLVKRPGDDATWRRYRVPLDPGVLESKSKRSIVHESRSKRSIVNCDDGKESPREHFRKVVFASGSPFPVFPAHKVEERLLVDGGYSNLIPVDAALTVSAEAVLIVGSSSPLAPERAGEAWWSSVPGELVSKSPRILGFLYERSQQVDRLSRSDLLVVSIAPGRDEPNWPLLTDFRPNVVDRMITTAESDLSRRIGLVQSWGRPRFVRTVTVPASGRSPN